MKIRPLVPGLLCSLVNHCLGGTSVSLVHCCQVILVGWHKVGLVYFAEINPVAILLLYSDLAVIKDHIV